MARRDSYKVSARRNYPVGVRRSPRISFGTANPSRRRRAGATRGVDDLDQSLNQDQQYASLDLESQITRELRLIQEKGLYREASNPRGILYFVGSGLLAVAIGFLRVLWYLLSGFFGALFQSDTGSEPKRRPSKSKNSKSKSKPKPKSRKKTETEGEDEDEDEEDEEEEDEDE